MRGTGGQCAAMHGTYVPLLLLLLLLAGGGAFANNKVAGNAADEAMVELVESLPEQNSTESEEGPSIAKMIDQTLRDEFPEGMDEFSAGKTFNTSITYRTAKLETVLRVIPGNPNPSHSEGEMEHVEMDVDRIIDTNNNEFVLSSPKGAGSMALRLDPIFIRDLTVIIAAASLAGAVCEALNQPVINGYLIAGSIVGPGGLALVSELVQMETLAQVGVQLLLFGLGLEFDPARVKAVQYVAILGGVLEIVLFTSIGGISASIAGWSVPGGLFVGALVAMSSTSIVVKCLEESGCGATTRGQIMIGTLILQDLSVGLFFAFMPLLGYAASHSSVSFTATLGLVFTVFVKLTLAMASAFFLARTAIRPIAGIMETFASPELLQLCALAFCMVIAWTSDQMGLSSELGAFVAGVMLSVLPDPEVVLHKVHQTRNLFVALFLASIGLIMSPIFLAEHLKILVLGTLLVVAGKTLVIATVVWLFHYPPKMAVGVALGLAQVGEFAFVLLSEATQMQLLPHQGYMMLLGVTALSLLITPVLMNISIALIGNDTGGVLMQKINIEAGHMGMAWTKEPQYRGDQPGAVEMMPISPPSSPMHSPRRHHRASCLGFTGRQRKRANAENDVPAAKSSNGEP
mmetsp:Transcript_24641/g.63994  ORF Transcript_24641/g.63994 Transcript_24641/m.63994 type:complete len:630 (+) Transcript_24641:288-2177(+)